MKITKKITVIITTLSAFLLGSCTIGLGEAIDLIGPSVTILTPEPRQCVKAAGFDITAKVTDDFAVKTITVECNGNSWVGQEGAWQVKTSNSSTYQADPLSTWSVDSDGKTVNFTIRSIKIPVSGTYNLSVTATDAANNISEESKKIRTVIVDTDPPKVTVSNPALYPATTESIEKLNAITDYRKITEVSKFVTGDFTLSGTTVDENTIEYIDVIIKETETDIVYLEKRLIKDTQFAEDKSCIELNSLRAWEFPVKLAEYQKFASLDESKHMFTVITCSRDSSGNREDTYVHGIFCMWKDADKPWIEMKLGDKSSPLSVYAGTTINGTAYDDTEISEVTSTVKKIDSSGAIVSQDILYERGTKVSENTIFYQLPVPKDCTTYYIEINAKDNNGKTAVSKTGYIEVVDKTFPSVELKHYIDETEKQIDQPLFGNKYGDFALEFIAKDDTDINHVKVAYVTNKDDIVTLSNTNAEQWNSPAYAASSVSELKNGKIYTLPDLNADGTETDPVFGITRLRYKTKINLNLFSDLDIGITRTLSNQTFVVLAEDGNGNKIVKTYTILGDITPPSITFEKIKYNNTFYTNTNTLLPAFDSESEVTVYGSFTDDSAATWLNVQKLDFTLECNGTKVEPDEGQETFKLTGEGKFEVTVKNLIGSSLSFRATVSDLARNTTIQDFGFLVDTNTPRVEYFYATNPDGNYGINDDITLKLRFNKKIKFIPTSGSSELPEITLNNNKTVKMKTAANTLTREFDFDYKIETSDDIPALNVKSIDLKGGSIQDSNGSEISDVETLINESWANNLNSRKSICIITCKPKVKAVVFDEYTGTVTISFTRTIQKGNGKIIISQKENGLRIPPVLSIAQYKVIAAKNSTLKDEYELSSNGADPNNDWKTDITPKYVLKYDKNCNDSTLVQKYIKTGLHKITQDVKSNACTLSSDDTITVKIGSLPCKGAQFDVTIEENFIYDKTGGTAYGNPEYIATYNSTGVELPVIRIKSQKVTVSNYAADYSNCLKSTFKIDCQSPDSTLTYSYDKLTRTATTYSVTNESADGETKPNRAGYSKQPTASTDYVNPIVIGSSDYTEGLTFHITATATSALNKDHTKSNYASISRTTIELRDLNHPMTDSGLKTNIEKVWPYTENPHICAFLKGGDNPNGPNTTQGLPTDWDVKNTEQCLLLQVSENNYYTVSWDITCPEYYFKVYAGLMDSETFANGPKAGIALQNCWVGGYSKYYVIPGEYMVINNKTNDGTGKYTNTDFEFENGGLKCQIYR